MTTDLAQAIAQGLIDGSITGVRQHPEGLLLQMPYNRPEQTEMGLVEKVPTVPTIGAQERSYGAQGQSPAVPIRHGTHLYQCSVCKLPDGSPFVCAPKGWGAHLHSKGHESAA